MPGVRNEECHRSGFNIGQLVADGKLDYDDAGQALLDAAPLAVDFAETEARNAIRSGLDAGTAHPRSRR